MIKQTSTNKILVVDDDAGGRRLTRATLARAGFDVIEAEDGDKALEILRAGLPDLILLDVSMPNKDGFTTCEELRMLPGADNVPVIMMTGLDDVASIERAFKVGASDFITKPINWPILPHRVRYMLRASAAIAEMNENKRRLSNAQRIGEMGDWLWDARNNRMVLSDQAWRIVGQESVPGGIGLMAFLEFVHPDDREHVSEALEGASRNSSSVALQHRILRKDGQLRHVHQQVEIASRDEQGRATQVVGAVHDVTQRTDAEEQIRRLAYYDTLTGLPNRLLYLEQLRTALRYAERNHQKVAVMFIDLDNFKRVNDTLGHSAGDELLKVVSHRLINSLRAIDTVGRMAPFKSSAQSSDSPSIARLGGDEFTVMVGGIKTSDDAAIVAKRFIHELSAPITLAGQEVYVGASVGIAIYPNDGVDIDSLVKHADIAMYRAKEDGKGRFHFYDPSMTQTAVARMKAESEVRHALERNEFEVHYQARLDVKTNRLVAAEALVRWRHPERGLVFPDEFISVCEDNKLIIPLGAWVIKSVCQQLATWREEGIPLVPVAINLAASHLREDSLVAFVAQTLQEHRLPAKLLEIEVTESILLVDPEVSIRNAKKLAASGVRLAIDDFGTGYSSLSYLKRLPVSYLKIDRSFVRDLAKDPSDAAIITATIAMAHMLDIRVVAEGVEDEQQLAYLRDRGCDQYQGFLYAKPQPKEDFAQTLRAARGMAQVDADGVASTVTVFGGMVAEVEPS
jgi:PAS domain S-box-containing protein